jgi:hypothetical protein
MNHKDLIKTVVQHLASKRCDVCHRSYRIKEITISSVKYPFLTEDNANILCLCESCFDESNR